MILIFGAIEFGRVFHATHVITSTAREGARVAAVGKPNTAPDSPGIDSIDEAVKKASNSLVSESSVYLKNNTDYNSFNPNKSQVFYTIIPYNPTDRTGENRTQDYVEIKVKGAVEIVVPIISLFFTENPKILESSAQMRLE